MSLISPLHSRTSRLCQSSIWIPWGKYIVPGCYGDSVKEESLAVRNSAALFDVSPFPKYRITGRDALDFLNYLCTRDFTNIKDNRVAYTAWCDPDGKVRQDGTVFRFSEEVYALYGSEPDLEWFNHVAEGYSVSVEDRSDAEATLSLQGPYSAKILQSISDINFSDLSYFAIAQGKIDGILCVVSRTGFTGDLGYEIWVDASDACQIWDAILAAGKKFDIRPCGLLALDVVRVEAGYILGSAALASSITMGELMTRGDFCRSTDALVDAQKVSPYEIGMGWAIDFTKDDFIGKQALIAEQKDGSRWKFVGIEIDQIQYEQLYRNAGLDTDYPPRVAQWVIPLYMPQGGRQVGHITSRVWSPNLDRYIAIGFIEPAFAEPDTLLEMECTVLFERRRTPCCIAKMPFFPSTRMKTKNPLTGTC
jgi:aminomethyltransferase